MKIEVYPEKARQKYLKLVTSQVNLFFENKSINPETVVSFNFVSKTKIKTLNKKYRQIDRDTDVLSFPIWSDIAQIPKKGVVNLGDIFICTSYFNENNRLEKMIIHSLNHLIGKHH